MMFAAFLLYMTYMFLNALCIKTAIDWGFDHNIGWGSALLFSLVSSMFVVLHKYRNTNNNVSNR
jgi:hypothetical protein